MSVVSQKYDRTADAASLRTGRAAHAVAHRRQHASVPTRISQLETILTLTRDLGVNLAGVEIILNMRRKMERMQSEVNEFMDYVKHELARGLGDWEQRLGTALVKSSPTDLVRLSSPPADVKPSTTKRPK